MKKFAAIGLALAALGVAGTAPALAQTRHHRVTSHRLYNYAPQQNLRSASPAYVPNSAGDPGATMQDY
jgi:hypothetical protein